LPFSDALNETIHIDLSKMLEEVQVEPQDIFRDKDELKKYYRAVLLHIFEIKERIAFKRSDSRRERSGQYADKRGIKSCWC
jgi:hypothetical protein